MLRPGPAFAIRLNPSVTARELLRRPVSLMLDTGSRPGVPKA